MNLSLDCHIIINRMSVKEFENEFLYVIKKDETNSDKIIQISKNIPIEIKL